MIDEGSDRDTFRQLDQVADVIDVIVRRDEVVDLFHARVGDGGHDPVQIPGSGEAGVDDRRLARGRDVEGRFSALDVDDPDLERLGVPGLRGEQRHTTKDDEQCCREALHPDLQSHEVFLRPVTRLIIHRVPIKCQGPVITRPHITVLRSSSGVECGRDRD